MSSFVFNTQLFLYHLRKHKRSNVMKQCYAKKNHQMNNMVSDHQVRPVKTMPVFIYLCLH